MYACVILYRSPIGNRLFAEGNDGKIIEMREFPDRDAAIAYAEATFSIEVPYQIVELDEL